VNISILDEDVCTKFGTKMQHGYVEMPA